MKKDLFFTVEAMEAESFKALRLLGPNSSLRNKVKPQSLE